MTQVTLQIQDNKLPLFLELASNLKFIKKVEVEHEPTKLEILHGLRDAVEELNLINEGKKKGKPARELFNEI
jgi:hypothetical protein